MEIISYGLVILQTFTHLIYVSRKHSVQIVKGCLESIYFEIRTGFIGFTALGQRLKPLLVEWPLDGKLRLLCDLVEANKLF